MKPDLVIGPGRNGRGENEMPFPRRENLPLTLEVGALPDTQRRDLVCRENEKRKKM